MYEQYFKILDINPDATLKEVKQAYRDLAQIWHPDYVSTKNPRLKKKAEEKMKELNEARSKVIAYLTEKQRRKTEEHNAWEQAEQKRAAQERAARARAERERAEAAKKAEEDFFRKRAEQMAAEAKAKKKKSNNNQYDSKTDASTNEQIIIVGCPKCGKRNRVRKIAIGFIVKCSECGDLLYFTEQEQMERAAEDFYRKRAEQMTANEAPLHPPKISDLQYRTIWAAGVSLSLLGLLILAFELEVGIGLIFLGLPFFIVAFGLVWSLVPKR